MGKKASAVARHTIALIAGARTARNAINNVRTDTHRITWRDWNGNILGITQAKHGSIPEFPEPVRKANRRYSYKFAEWTPQLVEATKNAEYTARFLELDKNGNPVIFSFYNHVTGIDTRFVTYYNDSYFDTPATGYDPSLTTFGLALALSTGKYCMDPKENADYVVELLEKIGCETVDVNDYYYSEKKDNSNIGIAIGIRRIDKPTLFIAIKGSNYGAEFAGNMIVGEGSDRHEGFSEAASRVMEFVGEVIRKHGLSGNVRMLTTGYSRGGATSNIVATNITDMIRNGTIEERWGVRMEQDDMYGFCYEPALCQPDCPEKEESYRNIVSILDPNDIVGKVPPAMYGFTLYGRVVSLKSNDPTAVIKMKRYMDRYFGRGTSSFYNVTKFVPVEGASTLGEMLDLMIAKIVGSYGGREAYAKNLQDNLSYTVYAVMDNLNEARATLASFEPDKMTFKDVLASVSSKEGFTERASKYIKNFNMLTDTDPKRMMAVVHQMNDLMRRMSPKDLWLIFQMVRRNYKCIVTPHYPLSPLSFLLAEDPNYRA